eukprot:TRINITY_DN12777_c0_g1_i1.p1 TRINITY_DN12777_c0_g1~~TRINITY_DN12777_c0_g1_i1.p1  ORF type:complete len:907 (+),score=261.91 TRINITY_DN12777_c0_g1_i1:252-2972(+)
MPPKKRPGAGTRYLSVSTSDASQAAHCTTHSVEPLLDEFLTTVFTHQKDNTRAIIELAIELAKKKAKRPLIDHLRGLIPDPESSDDEEDEEPPPPPPPPPKKSVKLPGKAEDTRGSTQQVAGIEVTPIELADRQGYQLELHNPTDKPAAVDAAFDGSRNLAVSPQQPDGIKPGTPSVKFPIPSDVPVKRHHTVVHSVLPPHATTHVVLTPDDVDEEQHLEFAVSETASTSVRTLESGAVVHQLTHPQGTGYSVSLSNPGEKDLQVCLDFAPSINLRVGKETPAESTVDGTKVTLSLPSKTEEEVSVASMVVGTVGEPIKLSYKIQQRMLKKKPPRPKPKARPPPEPESSSDDDLPPMMRAKKPAPKPPSPPPKSRSPSPVKPPPKPKPPPPPPKPEPRKPPPKAESESESEDEESAAEEGAIEMRQEVTRQELKDKDREDQWGLREVLCQAGVQTCELGDRSGWRLYLDNPTDKPLNLDVDFSGSTNLGLGRNQVSGVAVEDLAAVITRPGKHAARESGKQASVILQPGDKKHIFLDAADPKAPQNIQYLVSDSATVTRKKFESGVVLHSCAFPQGQGFGIALENPGDNDVGLTFDFQKSVNLVLDTDPPEGTEVSGTKAMKRLSPKTDVGLFLNLTPKVDGEPVKLVYTVQQRLFKAQQKKPPPKKKPVESESDSDEDVPEKRGNTEDLCGLKVTPILLANRQGYRVEFHNPSSSTIAVDVNFDKSANLRLRDERDRRIIVRPTPRAKGAAATAGGPVCMAANVTVRGQETVNALLDCPTPTQPLDLQLQVVPASEATSKAFASGAILHTVSFPMGAGFGLAIENPTPHTLKLIFNFKEASNVRLEASGGEGVTVDGVDATIEMPPKGGLTPFVALHAVTEDEPARLKYTLKTLVDGKPFRQPKA